MSQYRFGPFTYDEVTLELRREGRLVRLTERPARVLELLLKRAGSVVTKQELLDTVWDDVIVTEDALFHAVRELRHALGDDPRKPRFIQTVHRRGYRFIAPVEAPVETVPSTKAVEAVAARTRNPRVIETIAVDRTLHTGFANRGVPIACLRSPVNVSVKILRKFIHVKYVSKIDLKRMAQDRAGIRKEVIREIEKYLEALA